MSKEAMKLALEALEESLGYVEEEAENAQRLYGQYPTRQARIQGLKDDVRKHMHAITALREALAEKPAPPPECQTEAEKTAFTFGWFKALESVRQQPAQQEPVAWGVDWGKAGDISCVSIIKRLPDGRIEVVAVEYAPYSYTSPPAQRTWVGLTDEEIEDCYGGEVSDFARAIEAKLKEKNT
jgi:hypothetical protein